MARNRENIAGLSKAQEGAPGVVHITVCQMPSIWVMG